MKSVKENKVLTSTKYVVDHSSFVTINSIEVDNLANSFQIQPNSNWLQESPFDINSLNDEEKLMFSLIFNGISFSYWGEPYWNVEYNGVLQTRGSWSLVASIFRSIEEEKSLLDPAVLKDLDIVQMRKSLRGNTEIPLLQERLDILKKIGTVIIEKFGGKLSNFIIEFGSDALILQEAVVREFSPAFNDFYEYKGKIIYFNKRSQALVESIYSIFKGEGYGQISKVDELTALADYIIPNLLRNMGVIEYSKELANLIDTQRLIEKGSYYEIEIRASTIWAVELLKQKLLLNGIKCTSQSINDYLWTIGRDVKTPFHQVRTTAY